MINGLDDKFKNFETNEALHTSHQNLWDAIKAVLGGKCVAICVYVRKQDSTK